ncbi:hypothetical protein SAMN05444172_8435 [Burkholderia sp. GAS332]|nr:hypothetical protein SAMN05444172_8435 [Burkholderia sp. GAS332]
MTAAHFLRQTQNANLEILGSADSIIRLVVTPARQTDLSREGERNTAAL